MVDLTIKIEEKTLLCKHWAQLLPLASSIISTTLGAAHKALNKGLVATSTTPQNICTNTKIPQSTPLPGEDRLDSIIA